MKRFGPIFIMLLLLSLPTCQLSEARKVSTKLSAPKADSYKEKETEVNALLSQFSNNLTVLTEDSTEFAGIARGISFIAYDKKTSASKETFFVENGTDESIDEIAVRINYYNTSGKLIHSNDEVIKGVFPAGETRKVDIKSWDTQKSFHYIHSTPSKKGSTPYTVSIRVLAVGLVR